ncbi:MAG: hypothetical protein P9M00_08805 [Candidatus Tritonobacter lacicola]|nr:hypothetical protein [Candidatus Tritonobacter lacicola]
MKSTISKIVVLAIFVGLGCTAFAPGRIAADPWDDYNAAVADTSHEATADKISKNLTAIIPSNEDLIRDENDRILMAAWSDDWYSQHYQPGDYHYVSEDHLVWVTVVPQVIDFVKRNRVEPENLVSRLEQLYGLPPDYGRTEFVEFWVYPADLFRPSPDPEITDHESELAFPTSPYFTIDGAYQNWFNNLKSSIYLPPNPFPWTRLGYTYDWGDPDDHVGLSEFIVRGDVNIQIRAMTGTHEYCSPPVPLAVLKDEGGEDHLYGYEVPRTGDRTYWDAVARNPSPLARDLWMVPSGNNTVAMSELGAVDDDAQGLALLKGAIGANQGLYLYNSPVVMDWTYGDALWRNPHPLARDLWIIPEGNDTFRIADGGSSIASMKNQGGDYNLYLYNNPAAGDWSYWDALARNPSPLARDLWIIPAGNDAVAMCGLDTVGDGESDSLLVVRNEGGDYNLYLFNMPREGDWSYDDAVARNPSPRARDFWSIPGHDDVALVAGVDSNLTSYDALGVVGNYGGDYNLYVWNVPQPGDWNYWDAVSRNPSPLARDLWSIPEGNNIAALASPAFDR